MTTNKIELLEKRVLYLQETIIDKDKEIEFYRKLIEEITKVLNGK